MIVYLLEGGLLFGFVELELFAGLLELGQLDLLLVVLLH